MEVGWMRSKIRDVYDGPGWKVKVDRMADNQVIAIYHNFVKSGKFDNPKKSYKQMTIFDLPGWKEQII